MTDFRTYLTGLGWSSDTAEQMLDTPLYKMQEALLKERLNVLNQNLRSAPDFPSIRFVLGEICITEAQLDLLKSIYFMVYPPVEVHEEEVGEDGKEKIN